MKRKCLAWLLAFCLTVALWPGLTAPAEATNTASIWDGTAATGFAGGRGTEEKPYLIETAQQLAYLAQSINSGTRYDGQYISLEADLDLSRLPWTPIRNFNGTFLGNAHTITNLYINQPSANNQGLFGHCDSSCVIQNLRLTNVSVTGNTGVGGIAGYLDYAFIYDCNVSGSITGTAYVGGIAGYGDSSGGVYRCINNATVLANQNNAGGIVGDCDNINPLHISHCINSGAVDSYGGYVGGISGQHGTIANCMNTGAIGGNATNNVGGICSYYTITRITNCCNMGTVTSRGSVYGIAPYAVNCYNVGAVSTSNNSADAYSVAYNKTNCYALRTVAEELNEEGGNGLTILEQMNTPAFAATLNRNINTQEYATWLQDDSVYGGLPYFEPRTVSEISVSAPPSKTVYAPGETFNPSGMTVTAKCTDGSSYELSLNALTFFPNTPLTEQTSSVTVFYGTLRTQCAVTVSAQGAQEYEIESVSVKNVNGSPLSTIPSGDFLATVAIRRATAGNDTMVVLTAYTASGQFRGVLYAQVDEPIGATTRLTIPVSNPSGDIASVKAFAVSSFNDFRLSGNVVSFPAA